MVIEGVATPFVKVTLVGVRVGVPLPETLCNTKVSAWLRFTIFPPASYAVILTVKAVPEV
jgi:hypothetical protein